MEAAKVAFPAFAHSIPQHLTNNEHEMANYYTDHPEIGFYLNHPLMKRIVDLKEKDYADAKDFPEAPVNFEDAIENYKRMLEITGDVAANVIEPNSESVDL